MHKRLYSFLQQHDILYKNQFGFRKNNSTTFALLDLTEQIKESIDNKKYGCGVFIDIRKAFDTVNHDILLTKLNHYGIRGSGLQWFKSYLSNRKQFVSFNGVSSLIKDMSCGVPQGSCLGPLLFLIYINDLPNSSSLLNFHLFADDTHLYYESDSIKEIEFKMNKELKKISTWLTVNRLSLNVKKTNFVVFHPYNKPMTKTITLKIHRKAIAESDHVRYLGLLVDNTLTWKQHINKVTKTLSKLCGVLYKIRPYVTQDILIMLYNTLVYPHLTYGSEVWCSADKSHLDKILLAQKRLVRMMTFNDIRLDNHSFPPSNPLFHRLGILKINDIYKLTISKFVYRSLENSVPSNFLNWFRPISQIHNYFTRSRGNNINNTSIHGKNLYIPHGRTNHYGLKKTKVLGPKIWNDIPLSIRKKNSLTSFVNGLKSSIFNSYI